MKAPTRVVVLGAGFGGLEAILQLEQRFRDDPSVELLLVSESNFFLFTPLLPQIPSSYIEPRHIIQSLRDVRRHRRFRFLRARATGFDLAGRWVHSTAGDIPFDYLILALGSVPNYFGLESREHCFQLYTLEDGVVLRDHVLDLCEHANQERDPDRRRALLTFVVVGGGYTGVELVAELRDLLFRHVIPRYRGIDEDDVKLLLLEAAPEILRGVDPVLAARARRRLEQKGIELRTNAQVTRVAPGQVELTGGEKISAEIIVWTAGVRANPLIAALPGEKNHVGRVLVTPFLHLPEHSGVFAIGDNALVRDAPLEETVQIAPVAIEQARTAAENVARGIARQSYVAFEYAPKGMLVSLGMNDAVVNLRGFRFSGYFAWLFWNAVHLLKLVGLKKQLQVALDWSLASLFPRDTSIIRRPTRCRLCQQRPAQD